MKKIIFTSVTLLATSVFASGLSKPVWVGPKAIGMGGAFVGVADDTTAIYHNPAGITQLKANHNFQLGVDTLITDENYTPPAGTVEKAKQEYLPVPTFGYVNRQMKILSFGLGVFFPHGNGGKYDAPSAGLGNPTEGRIYSMEIDPTVAFQVIPELSIGASLRITRISTSLKGQFVPAVADTLDDLSTSGWGYGASAGVLITPVEWLRIGGNYRSKISKKLTGDGSFATLGNFDSTFDITLPTLITAGFSAQVLERVLFAFQYGYERNSEIKNFVLTSPDLGGAPATLTIPQNWSDSHTFHFGTKLDVCKSVSVLAGYARDFNKSIPDTAMNRITGDIDAKEVSAGLLFNHGKYNAGLSWNGRFGQRDIPVTATNPAPGYYKAFLHTISANVGLSL